MLFSPALRDFSVFLLETVQGQCNVVYMFPLCVTENFFLPVPTFLNTDNPTNRHLPQTAVPYNITHQPPCPHQSACVHYL